jgi:hypothetical protein
MFFAVAKQATPENNATTYRKEVAVAFSKLNLEKTNMLAEQFVEEYRSDSCWIQIWRTGRPNTLARDLIFIFSNNSVPLMLLTSGTNKAYVKKITSGISKRANNIDLEIAKLYR